MHKIISRSWVVSITTTLGLLIVLWAVNIALASGPVNSRISYQGSLQENGQPVTGSRTMIFQFYSDSSCTAGNEVGSAIKQSVAVTEGFFSVKLNADQSSFNGQGLWLKVNVEGNDINCQEILPTPYALSLRPGAFVESDSGIGIRAHSGGTGINAGLWGQNTSSGYGGYFYSQSGTGLHGASTDGVGIYGVSSASGKAAIQGNHTGFGNGGYFDSSHGTGIFGATSSSNSNSAAVWGQNPQSGYGGYFYSANGVGLHGASTGDVGIYGVSSASARAGVQGHSENASGYGGFFINTAGGILLAANNANSTSDLEFKVDSAGNVYADGGYNCNSGGTSGIFDTALGGGATGLQEGSIVNCLQDNSPADFAEMLPAANNEPLEPGDVLVIDSKGRLIRSNAAYQPSVVGIYSTRPSYLGNAQFADEEGYAPLALVGIVPVKASAENGPIQPGDLLTSASTPGHTMRCEGVELCFGRTIGKALEGLEADIGVIQMLVMLQ